MLLNQFNSSKTAGMSAQAQSLFQEIIEPSRGYNGYHILGQQAYHKFCESRGLLIEGEPYQLLYAFDPKIRHAWTAFGYAIDIGKGTNEAFDDYFRQMLDFKDCGGGPLKSFDQLSGDVAAAWNDAGASIRPEANQSPRAKI